eukprot:CAMPEP_0181367952 /NCGR_PEP_ID=MMETSP1106-20121128/11771_1 /TAXON_ID=81844 /ORGANISM="Mantoniella antarctica, Strain SL-175" /LENGTH=201 /DNA_ID=CAMNT_0023483921 /DNA_START=371 /DNA_END=976 /DNA_ORIENTATION=-
MNARADSTTVAAERPVVHLEAVGPQHQARGVRHLQHAVRAVGAHHHHALALAGGGVEFCEGLPYLVKSTVKAAAAAAAVGASPGAAGVAAAVEGAGSEGGGCAAAAAAVAADTNAVLVPAGALEGRRSLSPPRGVGECDLALAAAALADSLADRTSRAAPLPPRWSLSPPPSDARAAEGCSALAPAPTPAPPIGSPTHIIP